MDTKGDEPTSHRLPISRQAAVAAIAALMIFAAVLGLALSKNSSQTSASEPQLREFTLVVEEVDWEIQPGVTVKAWTYNGTMPGPEIRVRERDTVRITLVNKLPVGTTLHWHGLDVPNAMDGPAGLNQAPIEPGDSFVYEFIASPAGTRWYHSHTDVGKQVKMGLFGSFIVEPLEPTVEFDREYTMVLSEWDMELTPDIAAGVAPLGPRDQELRGGELGTDFFLMNGHMFEAIPPVFVKEGERLLIRVINAGDVPHPIHTHGHSFMIVATDGNPVPEGAILTKDTVLVAPGERVDLLMVAANPGVWMLHCHIEHHAENGMMTVIQYDGAIPPGPAGEGWGSGDHSSGMDHGNDHHVATPEPAQPTPEPAAAASPAGVVVKVSDNRFTKSTVSINAGETVTWENIGSNLHSVLPKEKGAFAPHTLGKGEAFTAQFDTPGSYRYVCLQHFRQGMSGVVEVLE